MQRRKMYRLLSLCCFLVFAAASNAQRNTPSQYSGSIPKSYVRTWNAAYAENDPNILSTKPVREVKQATAYVDGLGRPLQTVVKKGSLVTSSNTNTDLISSSEYDQFGRVIYTNLHHPDPAATDGLFKLNPFQPQVDFYNSFLPNQDETNASNNRNWAYSQVNYESSPVNRIEKQYAPGRNWVGGNRSIETKYWFNTPADDVKKWNVNDVTNGWGTYSISGTPYSAGELYKTVVVDEHSKQIIEFKDKEGKIILKKVQLTASADDGNGRDNSGWLCTYYIYDDFNNLRCVIQPEGVKALPGNSWALTPFLNDQCFRYEYDKRNRMIRKKVPGADEVWMVYDNKDRLVMTQDGNMRSANQKKWTYTLYDDLNRPVSTGLITDNSNYNNLMYHLDAAYDSPNYPNLANYPGYEELTKTGYDDYTTIPAGSGLTKDFDNAYNSHFNTSYNSAPDYPQALNQSFQVRGLVTWTQVKVLGTSTWLYTVNIYDEKGRVIQVKTKNIFNATDILTTQYTWAGQPLITVVKTEITGSGAQTSIIVTKYTYDDLGRTTKIEKKQSNSLVPINGNMNAMSAYTVIATTEYDALGQVKKKSVGSKKDFATNTYYSPRQPLEEFDYEYNIRGWLLGLNRSFLETPDKTHRWFGFDIAYDRWQGWAYYGYYWNQQYNGNITGMIWKSKGDKIARKADFVYDAANRLLRSDYNQQNGGGISWEHNEMDYSVKMGDGANPGSAFDDNGNIKSMTQYGWKLGVSPTIPIDNLTYIPEPGTNRLKQITDANNDYLSKLGDFKYDPATKTSTDYSYDINGNLTADNNKKISSITYNHLNLPLQLIITGKGDLNYTYDAIGNKLKKITNESGVVVTYNGTNYTTNITTTTFYIAGAVYESKSYSNSSLSSLNYADRLQFIGHEEGRIRFKPAEGSMPACFEYDYFVKDHLGNVRMVLTEEVKQDVYPATTLENTTYNNGTAVAKESEFYTIDNTKIVNSSTVSGLPTYQNNNGNPPYNNNPYSNYTANSQRIYQLNAATNTMPNKTGLGIVLKVMAGDNINIYGKSYHKKPVSGYTTSTNSILVSDIIGAFAGSSIIISKGVSGSQITGQSGFPTTMSGLIGNQPAQDANRPKAAINWIVFDEQFKWVSGGFDMVKVATNSNGTSKDHDLSTIPTIPISKNGYIYVYVSNESQYNVWFDNLQLFHKRGPLLEETHYYPFGLIQKGISSQSFNFGNPENKEKFNSIDWQNDLGLNEYDAKFRDLDPQTGRWWQIDPKPNDAMSLYAAMDLNPIRYADPLGDTTSPIVTGFKTLMSFVPGGAPASLIPNNTTGEKIIGAGFGAVEAGRDALVGIKNVFAHPLQTLDGISQMTTIQGQANMGMNVAINYVQSKAEFGTAFTNYRFGSYFVTSVGIAIFGPKIFKGANQLAAEGYVAIAGKSGSFSSVRGFSLRMGANDFVYHNSLTAAQRSPWSTPTSFSSPANAFNSLALDYPRTTNFAQMKFTLKNYGLFVKGTAAAQGTTAGQGTQLLSTPFTLRTNLSPVSY